MAKQKSSGSGLMSSAGLMRYYDADKRAVVKHPAKLIKDEEKSKKALGYLQSTDWKVLRHIRETQLEIETTLTVAEYVALEKERHKQAKLVK